MAKPTQQSVSSAAEDDNLTVVGIGASAGGLAAFEAFFEALPSDSGMAYVIVQHLAPDQKSELSSIIGNYTSIPVEVIAESTRLQPNHVYVIPPGRSLSLEENTLSLHEPSTKRREHVSIDRFFASMAEAKRDHAIAVVLSGNQSDGSRGVIAVKERGGLALAQDPDEAEFPSMPKSAIDTDRIDLVLPAADLAARLGAYGAGTRKIQEPPGDEDQDRHFVSSYEAIIDRLQTATGHNFSNYKQSTILRRIERRLQLRQVPDLKSYLEFLDDHPEETHALFDDILITVTDFFRDPHAFAALEKQVIPRLFNQKVSGKSIRIWVPACATGEEAYSIAILMWEEAQRRGIYPDFKIFATDIDPRAIEQARAGIYPDARLSHVADARRERFFSPVVDGLEVVSELRDRMLFAVHDLLRDPPFARQDLVSCRNLLIYLDRKGQSQVFNVLHYALHTGGRLFLGTSEFLGDASNLFDTVDKNNRIYEPKDVDRQILPIARARHSNQNRDTNQRRISDPSETTSPSNQIKHHHHRLLSDQYAPPGVIIDKEYQIQHVAGDVRDILHIPAGEPTSHLLEIVDPKLRLPLRAALVDAFNQGHTTSTGDIELVTNGVSRTIQLLVRPIVEAPFSEGDFAQITFETTGSEEDVETDNDRIVDISNPDESLQKVIDQLETENKRLKQRLDHIVDSYETTTEELETSNEELLTINEELQSTTEELETSTEELQSTNEELITVNEELSYKVKETEELNKDLENFLSSTELGTIFLNRDFEIRRFSAPAKDYFNLIDSDRNRPLAHVTHNLDYEDLMKDVTKVLEDKLSIEREIKTEDGRWLVSRILPYLGVDDRVDGVVLTFFDITERKQIHQRLAERELLFRTVFDQASDGLFLLSLDSEGDTLKPNFTEVNQSLCSRLGYSERQLLSMNIADIIDGSSLDIDAYLQTVKEDGEAIAEVRFLTRSGQSTTEELRSRYLTISNQAQMLTISRDISRRKAHERALTTAKDESERLAELRATFLANMSHEIRTPLTSIIGISQLFENEDLSERQAEMIRIMRTSGRRLQQTLDSVLDISRIEAGEMSPQYAPIDVAAQIQEDIDILRPMASRRELSLQFQEPEEHIEFGTDAGFLSRIVYNLVENAIKFTNEGGVTVTVEFEDDRLQLVVADTGIGIDEEFLPHLFDKFKQASGGTSRNYDGSGLGMALVHHLVDLMQGEIDVESEKGKGTTFEIVLPEHDSEDT